MFGSCKKDDPAPALSMLTIKSGTIDLNTETTATNVSISLPITVTFSTAVDVSTATSNNIALSNGTGAVASGVTTTGASVTITPNAALLRGTTYTLSINSMVKSDKGSALSNPASRTFTTEEPNKVYFFQVIASPTDQESITLKNGTGSDQDISSWTLGDTNNPIDYKIPAGTILLKGATKAFSHTTIGFQINDSGEVLYLKNASGTEIDRWTN